MSVLMRTSILFPRAPPSWPNRLPKAAPLSTITLGVRISTYNLGVGEVAQTFSLHLFLYSHLLPRSVSSHSSFLGFSVSHLCICYSLCLEQTSPIYLHFFSLMEFGSHVTLRRPLLTSPKSISHSSLHSCSFEDYHYLALHNMSVYINIWLPIVGWAEIPQKICPSPSPGELVNVTLL